MQASDPTLTGSTPTSTGDQSFADEVLALRLEIMAYAAQAPLIALGIAGLMLSLLPQGEGIAPGRIAPYQLALIAAGASLWQARARPRLALRLCGWGTWVIAFTFALTRQDGFSMIGLAVACALNVLLIGPLAGWATWGVTSLILMGGAFALPPHILSWGNTLTIVVWAGLSTLLAHTVWRVLLRTLRWMQDTYTEAQTQAHLLRDKSAELALALKSLGQTSSQLARLNEQLEIARQHAEDARRSKEEFAASVSHELRAPLNLIIGFSDLILREPQVYGVAGREGSPALPPKLMADIALIHRHAQHLLKLVNDILDLSQMDANHLTVQQEVVPAAELIDRAVVEYEDLIRQRGLNLNVQIQPNLPEVYADRTRIHQVLLNLLNNALRFTDAGGITITARSQKAEIGQQMTDDRRQTTEVVISVSDTGVGIAPDDLKRLFEPFVQVGDARRRKREGSGLGLAISRRFIELHGGRMWVESAPGMGSTFSFTLPVKPAEPIISLDRMPRAPGRREVGCLAVIESMPLLSPLLSRHIRGLRVVRADSLAALAGQDADCPEVIVLNEPASPGWPVSPLPAAISNAPVIRCYVPGPIGQVSQTAHVTGDFIRRYLVKPVTREQIHEAISILLSPQAEMNQAGARPMRSARLLIVEDDEDTAALLSRMARSAPVSALAGFSGLSVVKARSGEQALELLRLCEAGEQNDPATVIDGMLLDLGLGAISGFDVLAEMERHAAWRRIPVCLISGQTARGEYLATPYLSFTRRQPFTVRELMQAIADFTRLVAPGVEISAQ